MSSIKIKGLDEALKSEQKSSRARELTSEGVYKNTQRSATDFRYLSI